jgi:hypothetical protein
MPQPDLHGIWQPSSPRPTSLHGLTSMLWEHTAGSSPVMQHVPGSSGIRPQAPVGLGNAPLVQLGCPGLHVD